MFIRLMIFLTYSLVSFSAMAIPGDWLGLMELNQAYTGGPAQPESVLLLGCSFDNFDSRKRMRCSDPDSFERLILSEYAIPITTVKPYLEKQ